MLATARTQMPHIAEVYETQQKNNSRKRIQKVNFSQ